MNKIIAITALIFVAIVGMGLYSKSNKAPATPIDPTKVLEISADDHVSGNPDSDVVFVEYLDLECPACGAFHPIMDEVKAANPDIAIVTRHFPLYFHRNARAAAHAAEAAAQQDKFEEMVTAIFNGQQLWSGLGAGGADDVFVTYATELGLDLDAFNTYRNSDEARAKVTRDYDGGVAAGVDSTPTFLLQGRKIRASSPAEFQQLIDAVKAEVSSAAVVETEEVVSTTTEQ